jgi:Fe-S oxidoreductase
MQDQLMEISPVGLEKIIFYLAFLAGIIIFGIIIRKYIKLLLKFRKLDRSVDIAGGISRSIKFVFGQKRLLDDPFSGAAHFSVFWGFVIICFGTINFFGKGFWGGFNIPVLYGLLRTPFLFLLDLFSFLVIFGILAFVFKRYLIKPKRLTQSSGAALILILIFGLMVFDLLSDGFNMAAQQAVAPGSFIGAYLATIFWSLPQETSVFWAHFFWWAHFLFFMAILNYVPLGKHMHIFSSLFNVFLANPKSGTALTKPDLEHAESFGITKVEEHTWKDYLDGLSCTECGRCQDACPAYNTGKPLSPKNIIMQLRHHAEKKAPHLFSGKTDKFTEDLVKEVITEEVIWACTTCYGCQRACPLFIEHIPKLIDYRRSLVLNEGAISTQGGQALKNMEKAGDPWGLGQAARADWHKGLPVNLIDEKPESEWLFWVGCAGALDARNVKVSQATVKLMNTAGIDYAILGAEETCTGDSARRLGEEYLFQTMAAANVEMLNSRKVKKIFTNCPHCFNTLKNEYPAFGGLYEVHHTHELLAELIKSGELKIDTARIKNDRLANDGQIVFHDSCYLGRHNGLYAPSRYLIDLIGKRIEMKRHRDNSFCCGAGGARMWLEETIGKRINIERTEEALATGAPTIGVACPFCMTMLEDGIKAKDKAETNRVVDITELLAAGL